MGRWEPDAQGRLRRAALDLFLDAGYDATTVADIAVSAGVTERTFFRYYADKREVLFDATRALDHAIVAAVAAAPDDLGPLETAGRAMTAAADVLTDREWSRRRGRIIAATPALQERERLKLAALGAAVADALRERGVAEQTALLAAESSVTVFHAAFQRWIATEDAPDLAVCVQDSLAALKGLAAAS